MKISTAVALLLALCSTSALALQERTLPVPAASEQAQHAQTNYISQFSNDDNDGAIAQAYGQGLCSPSAASNCTSSFSTAVPHK